MPHLSVVFTLCLVIALPANATAALPPFELVQKSLVQARGAESKIKLDLQVTETHPKLSEWTLSGLFEIGVKPNILERQNATARELLWIAVLSADPVAEVQRLGGLVDTKIALVGVQEEFVYVYGKRPAVSVRRDLKRLAAISLVHDKRLWVVRLTWRKDVLTGVMITRDGSTALTARAAP